MTNTTDHPTLKALRAHEVACSDELMRPGDFYIRNVPLYNSPKVIHAIVLKCPFCGIDMMSTEAHKISRPSCIWKFFFPSSSVTVSPKLVCPYVPSHSFSITNGRIATIHKNG